MAAPRAATRRRVRVPHARQAPARTRLARRLRRGARPSPKRRRRGRGEEDEVADQQLPRLLEGEEVQTRKIESARKETKPPATLQRRLAARGDGDGRQARRRRRAARGDEGLGHRHAGDPRGDHRAPDRGRLRRARRPGAGRDREGPERDPAAQRARADLAGPDRQLGAAARQDRARRGLAQAVHERHRRLRRRDRQAARRDAQRRAHPPREARSLPGVRPRDRREPQGVLVLGARGSRLRLRDLEGESRQAAARSRSRAS